MKNSICFAISTLFFLVSGVQKATSKTSPYIENTTQENYNVSPRNKPQFKIAQASVPSYVQEELQQYTPEQIAKLASQISSHPKCTATAVQNYFGGNLDWCKAFYVATDADKSGSSRTNRYLERLKRETDPDSPHNRDWADSFCHPHCD